MRIARTRLYAAEAAKRGEALHQKHQRKPCRRQPHALIICAFLRRISGYGYETITEVSILCRLPVRAASSINLNLDSRGLRSRDFVAVRLWAEEE